MYTTGERIKIQRKQSGLTQTQLGEKIGISLNGIKKLETNRINPSVETLNKLSDLFGVSVDYLMVKTDEPNKESHQLILEYLLKLPSSIKNDILNVTTLENIIFRLIESIDLSNPPEFKKIDGVQEEIISEIREDFRTGRYLNLLKEATIEHKLVFLDDLIKSIDNERHWRKVLSYVDSHRIKDSLLSLDDELTEEEKAELAKELEKVYKSKRKDIISRRN